ncbi:DUF1566 domain-containing protein [Thiospirillum jenense]|uniref:DUF1566 domain-containing protein n=1 Tax=Thiospirillum jenense TaxID=1653858 RepID=A0A839HAH3_9GAMM|nr:DUF1566 domain-containing protein [Thiospirillum jenense]MBB1125684.1 DUF1566 domain-containing protein [Thiospirillum jenense]
MNIKHLSYHAITALVLFTAVTAAPAHAALNDTGITACSDGTTAFSPLCPIAEFPRQDGDYGRDAEAIAGTLIKTGGGDAGFDFTKISNSGAELPADAQLGNGPNDWACTRDNVTNLIWEVKTDDGGLRDQDHNYSWYDSNSTDGNLGTNSGGVCFESGRCDMEKFVYDVNSTELCGFSDWRMPTVKELGGIVHLLRIGPAIDDVYFPNTYSTSHAHFWTAARYAADPNFFWAVSFYQGETGAISGLSHIRLVRGESAADVFIDNDDGTVTQLNTGLMWSKCNAGLTGNDCTGDPLTMNWSEALNAAAQSTLGNYTDWRLPNIKELQALVEYDLHTPAINPNYFLNAIPGGHWSSSPFYHLAWNADFLSGQTGPVSYDYGLYVRLVRDIQSSPAPISECGANWQPVASIPGHNQLYAITYGNGQFVAVGGLGAMTVILTSADGSHWTPRYGVGEGLILSVIWTGNQFVAVDENGIVLTSADGVNWTGQTTGTTDALNDVVWNGNQFAAVGVNGVILTSPDGVNWTARTSGTSFALTGVTWGHDQFVAVNTVGDILVSADGVNWTTYASGVTEQLTAVVWNGSQFVAVGAGGIVLTSADGSHWTRRTSGTEYVLENVIWNGSQFVAVGALGTILTSPDGVNWTARTTPTDRHLYGITWTGYQFVVVGEDSGAVNQNSAVLINTCTTPPAPASSYPFSLTINGGGNVNSDPGLDNNQCSGVTCTGTYSAGAVVTLTAQANEGWQFQGWGGACTGIEACILTINAATDVIANFTQLTNQYQLDSPVNGSYESGIGVVHGWVCNANSVTVQVDDTAAFEVAYGAERLDSQTVCGDSNNGFAAAINWSDYGTGEHVLKLIADGVELTRAAVMVTRLGDENFLTGLIKTTTVVDFPAAGQNTLLTWSEPNQNFVVTNAAARAFSIERAANGNWESPTDGGIESGRALIRGWACDAGNITFTLDGTTLIAPYGSGRGDTQSICGDSNNGYALAINWNDYADGAHQIALNIDGAVVATRQFTIATPGGLGSITGVQHQHTVTDFPNFGDQLTLQWSEPHQNFRIINYQPSTRTNAERITEIYIATLGYAPDNDGLQYWENELRGGSWTPTTVAQAFFDNDTVRALYPAENGNDLLIDALYHNIFNRAADETGKTYWLDELNSGHFTRDQMIIALIDGGWANADAAIDMARFGNQVQVGLAFANAQAERGIIYNALTPERQTHLRTLGAQIIRDVTADAATVTAAIAQIPGLLDTL